MTPMEGQVYRLSAFSPKDLGVVDGFFLKVYSAQKDQRTAHASRTTCAATINQYNVRKLPLRVLWRKKLMPAYAPILPPAAARVSRTASGTRHPCRTARRLSRP